MPFMVGTETATVAAARQRTGNLEVLWSAAAALRL
jgi:hypothetical protein